MTKIIIFLIGIALIGFIAWWFFGQHQVQAEQAVVNDDQQNVDIEVKGGYSPERVVLKKGVPATLKFKRTDASTCLDHVIFSDLGIDQKLPQGQVKEVKIDTTKPGVYDWACGMNMFHGQVIVK
ncbi:cupredoxin domain-containing protein [Lactobacillus sp. ESL0677]|uniref:cupredoxin domain-containing protein n=1 Tax=Lactobacillus sp. ESL0677 TaxID=2983208 RepID=UPI0023FA0117|nr:cupredoxin domain-containing protein [Lactobacillus sp. ESL0677]WEV37634.1 cupredoxin domain-containing protein [Lactobacillus sp. ESL0677]